MRCYGARGCYTFSMEYIHRSGAQRAYLQSAYSTALYGALLIILSLRLLWGLFDYDPLGVLASSLALVFMSAACLCLARLTIPGLARTLLIAQPIIGIIGISAIVHFSGGASSNLIFLYSIPALSSIWVSGTFALFTALAAIFSLGMLLGAELAGSLPTVTKSGYEASQLLAIHMSRLILLLSVVLGASLMYKSYFARKHRAYADLHDETIYKLAQELPQPVASAILSRFEADSPLRPQRALSVGLSCTACRSRIILGQTYWGYVEHEIDISELGQYRNDIHCAVCHKGQVCDICAAYAPATAREALS